MKNGAFEVDDSILLVSANEVPCRSAVRTSVWQDFPLVMKIVSIPTISPQLKSRAPITGMMCLFWIPFVEMLCSKQNRFLQVHVRDSQPMCTIILPSSRCVSLQKRHTIPQITPWAHWAVLPWMKVHTETFTDCFTNLFLHHQLGGAYLTFLALLSWLHAHFFLKRSASGAPVRAICKGNSVCLDARWMVTNPPLIWEDRG